MAKKSHKAELLARRRKRIRKRVSGSSDRPRLSIFRSRKHIYAQIIDDSSGRTLAAASSVALKISGGNVNEAKLVGQAIAEKAKACATEKVCLDRNGRLYHGRVKALAQAAREAGLQF